MNGIFVPADIEVLLHYYCNDQPHPEHNSTLMNDIIVRFRLDGIFTDNVQPEITKKGKAWLNMILNTPYPRQVYVDQNGKVIEV